MELNPYAKYLGSNDPIRVIEATPGTLSSLTADCPSEKLTQSPAPGKWDIREIVCHLADTEIAFAFRLRQTLAEPDHVIQPFDQDHWATRYNQLGLQDALDAFAATRKWNLAFIRAAGPAALGRTVTHPERGTMTFGTIIQTMAGHDLNHIGQIEKLVRC